MFSFRFQETSVDDQQVIDGECTRVLQDRVTVLEQDHKILRDEVSFKTAQIAEKDDFDENVRNEVYFIMDGLPAAPAGLDGRAWQDFARDAVQAKVRLLLGRETKILHVINASRNRRDGKTSYIVRLESVEDSRSIRDSFGRFFRAGAAPMPADLKGSFPCF